MTIHLDRSPSHTVVITCSLCPYWSAIRFGMRNAHECAANHERTFHHEDTAARAADRQYRYRHADDSSNVTTPSADSLSWESETLSV